MIPAKWIKLLRGSVSNLHLYKQQLFQKCREQNKLFNGAMLYTIAPMQNALSILQLLYDVGIKMKQECADVGDTRKEMTATW